jgi:chemotaxis protein MotB
MARKKEPEKPGSHERWMVSYADLLTLLFAVFVTLYAMSQADKKKVEEVSASIQQAFNVVNVGSGAARRPAVIYNGKTAVIPEFTSRPVPPSVRTPGATHGKTLAGENDFKAMKASIDAYLLKTGGQDKVSVTIGQRGLVVSLKEAGFFDSGSAELKGGAAEVLGVIADLFQSYANRCRVEGHTDDVPIGGGRFASNWDLSTARATGLVKELVRSCAVEPTRISATGYGEYQPVADNTSAEGRAKNRRVDIVLMSSEAALAEPARRN